MGKSLMLESIYAEQRGERLILVDLGYLLKERGGEVDPEVDARYHAMLATGLGKKRFSLDGFPSMPRLIANIPPTKLRSITDDLPIVEGKTYFRATHHWRGLAKGE